MARIAGVNIPNHQHAEIALTAIYGIGRIARARDLRRGRHRAHDARSRTCPTPRWTSCASRSRKFTVEGDLRREVSMNIKRLMDLGCYRGVRHARACRCAASARAPTRAPARARARRVRLSKAGDGLTEADSKEQTRHGKGTSTQRACARRSRRTSPRASPTFTRPSTTPSSPSPTARATRLSWATSRRRRLQGLAQVHAVRGAGRRRARRPRRAGIRREEPRSAHQGPRPRPRVRGARAERARLQDHQHRRRDAGAAQRLPPAQEAAASNGDRTDRGTEISMQRCRQCRREGEKLFLKGEKCFTDKCADRAPQARLAPGQHGQKSTRLSDYGTQLREKQKMRRIYGVLERQFRNYFDKADRARASPARACCRCWRAAWTTSSTAWASAPSRTEARQIVRHNGDPGERQAREHPVLPGARPATWSKCARRRKAQLRIKASLELAEQRGFPSGSKSTPSVQGHVQGAARSAPSCRPTINESLVVELYSK